MNKNHSYIDKIKFIRWLNIRKTTLNQLNKDLKKKINFKITLDNCETLDSYSISLIAEFLDITSSKILRLPLFKLISLKCSAPLKSR